MGEFLTKYTGCGPHLYAGYTWDDLGSKLELVHSSDREPNHRHSEKIECRVINLHNENLPPRL